MAEEFEESEVIFSDQSFPHRDDDDEQENSPFGYRENLSEGNRNSLRQQKKKKQKKQPKTTSLSNSVPVNIPENVFRNWKEEFFDGEGRGGEIIPPHVIVGRRIQGEMAFSVCTGNGRTLKGRDLSRVRNSVLRMTGFLEA